MKATRSKPKPAPFEHVFIELETQEELDGLWHILYVNQSENLRQYMIDKPYCEKAVGRVWHPLWSKLNSEGGGDSQ